MNVEAVVKGALRKIGSLDTGGSLDASEGVDALETLQQMYLEMVGNGLFGRQADISVPASATDFTARENARYTVDNLRSIAISLPETVTDTWWRYSWNDVDGYTPRYGSLWVPPGNASLDTRPPRDGSIVTAADLSSSGTRTYVYDSAIARWVSLQDLAYGDEAPLSTRYGDGLMCELAIRLAPEYGEEPSAAVVLGAARGRSAMAHRFDSQRRTVPGVYY